MEAEGEDRRMRKTPGISPTGAEQDAHSKYWRGRLVWTRGELRKIKKQTNRKTRMAQKRALRREED